MSSWTRSLVGCFLDRFVAWKFGLPAEICSYRVDEVRIPAGEGTSRCELLGSLYRPNLANDAKPLGTVLVRCPYGRGLPISLGNRLFASRGYQVLIVSCRGTFGSGGEFEPFSTEVEDGKAVVEWMRKQDWYTGSFATMGGSYLGFTQWALLVDPPEDLVAAVIAVGPHDMGQMIWHTGALNLDIVAWADSVSHQEEPGHIWRMLTGRSKDKLAPVFNDVPLSQAVKTHFGDRVPWVNKMVTTHDRSDPYYAPMKLTEALERSKIPVLLQAGWYDLFIQQNMEQYFRLSQRGCNVALTVGPWTHVGVGLAGESNQQMFNWLQKHLAHKEIEEEPLVQYYVTGAEEWRKVLKYPGFPTADYTLFLHGDGKLSEAEPLDVDSVSDLSRFAFDPLKPTPSMGGTLLVPGTAGMVDDSALAARNDVLVFDTLTLQQDIEFCGQIVAELIHEADGSYADLFIRISEVDEKGKSHNICDTYKRLDPNVKSKVVTLSLDHRAHKFLVGRKIRLIIAGGSSPHFAKNIGTENLDNGGKDVKTVQHTVYHGRSRISKIVLPVVAA